jgi:hypothetical protein
MMDSRLSGGHADELGSTLHPTLNAGVHASSEGLDLRGHIRSDTKKHRVTHTPTSLGLALNGEYLPARAAARAARPGVLGGMS